MKPTVHLYTVCWDEADMLGFFFRHYDPWVDRYVVYDDGSTDGSVERLRAHPKVELRRFERVEADSFVLSHKAMQDEAWKESRDVADWIVVTAIDEHLHVPGSAMGDYLARQQALGVTMLPALGFDMNHPTMPQDHGLLVERVTRGRARAAFNKLSIFRPRSFRDTGFGPGRHVAEPRGDLKLPAQDRVVLWHYKHLGFERNAQRESLQAQRLGTIDLAHGYGQHYLRTRETLRSFWDEMENESTDLAAPGSDPRQACIRPLWWEQRRDIVRVPEEPAPTDARPIAITVSDRIPTVSVLIKAYQHAPYVRQAIDSVLAQEGVDLEVVVTDDGSTDGTLEILQGYTDPRIRLLALPRNQGISAAMNATVSRARGRYLAILNSDDWALPGRFARQVAFLEAHPAVSLLFGMPRPVDEAGQPIDALHYFRESLRLPDFSRRTWLRQFFLRHNVLCAPTAMIRREAYDAAGPYDPRLFNLQDLDMWIRMLLAGHAIHVLDEELTAFRVRDGNANASAPRRDNRLRTTYENIFVLQRYAIFDEALFQEVFGSDTVARSDAPIPLRLAELASTVPDVTRRNLALLLYREAARTPEDFLRLVALGGEMDALNIDAVDNRDRHIAQLDAIVADRELRIAELSGRIGELDRSLAEHAHRIVELDTNWRALRRLVPQTARVAADRLKRVIRRRLSGPTLPTP